MDPIVLKMLYHSNRALREQHKFANENITKEFLYGILSVIKRQVPRREYRSYFWPSASLAMALEIGYSKTGDEMILDSLVCHHKKWIRGGSNIHFLDQIMNGYTLLYIYGLNDETWINESLHKMFRYVLTYPRTITGALPYRTNNPEVVLVDYLGMICPFLARYGKTFKSETSLDLSSFLLEDFLSNGMDRSSGLPYHGYRCDTGEKLGIIGWGRGVGWLLIGLVDTLAYLDQSSEKFLSLKDKFSTLIDASIVLQNKDGYYNWMLSATEGQIDTSATAMIGYSIKRAIDLGFLDNEYLGHAENAYQALLESTRDGLIYDSSAECHGLGMYPQRYEWNAWGQGFGTAFALIMQR
jgi:unsaturated rhamnogalacturonyl hydrolase